MRTYYKVRFKLVIIGILILQISICQENYLSGLIITINEDTIQGQIDYRNWDRNPNVVSFKDTNSGVITIFSPIDIKLFKVKDEIYVSAVINTEVSPSKTKELNYNMGFQFKKDTAFLQTIIQGEKSLYYYKNKTGKENFYTKIDDEFNLLLYKKYIKNINGKNVIMENKKYIGQLVLYFNNCSTIQAKLTNIRYNLKSLIKLFLYYYDCSESEIKFQKKIEKISTEIGVLAGATISSLKFKHYYESQLFIPLVNTNYSPSINITSGLFFNFVLPRNQRKWSIYNDLIYTNYQFQGIYNDFVYENRYTIYQTKIGYSYIKMNNLLRYTYPFRNKFLIINAGITNGYAVNEINYKKKEIILHNSENIIIDKAMDHVRRHEQSYIFGLGLKFNNYILETRYEKGNGMSNFVMLKSLTNRYYFILGYQF